MADEKKIGDINVKMGSGNNVGHIGHKITFHAPPPSPNAIWQQGRVVGEIGASPFQDGNLLIFERMVFHAPYVNDLPIEVQGVQMLLEGCDVENRVKYGFTDDTTLVRARCRLLG
ncbi:hypothetical protein G6L96_009045 [Agrobacterium tumefaciens]|uniref:hypothetical protein n=1 Tax=Agrobacterium tumefaciens TaxID=358 RepID=UPI00157221B8|nr:hypothetical protein [Agrobacterium tumefaciens]WCK69937.1 hypothetical protein G6L96_009045 [Agrobacterium tumefaciens]